MRMRKLVLDLSVAQILPEKINKVFLPKKLGFIDVLSTVGPDLTKRAVFKLLGQNQADKARLPVLIFWRPCNAKDSDFRVSYCSQSPLLVMYL